MPRESSEISSIYPSSTPRSHRSTTPESAGEGEGRSWECLEIRERREVRHGAGVQRNVHICLSVHIHTARKVWGAASAIGAERNGPARTPRTRDHQLFPPCLPPLEQHGVAGLEGGGDGR